MPIIRAKDKGYFTQIPNKLLTDKRLSNGARGLLSFALSHCDNWDFNGENYFVTDKDKKTKIKKYLNELMKYGYLIRYQEKSNNGVFGKIVYIFRESPLLDKPVPDSLLTVNQITAKDKISIEKQTMGDLPTTGSLIAGNQLLKNTNLNNINISKNKEDRVTSLDKIINSYSENKDIKDKIRNFLKMRKVINKPATEEALIEILKELDSLSTSDNEKIEILNQSTVKCWVTVYPLNKIKQRGGNDDGEFKKFITKSDDSFFSKNKF